MTFRKIILGGLLAVGLIVGAVLPAQAAEHKNTVWAQSGGKTVLEEALLPGGSYTRAVQLYNDSDIQAVSHFSVQQYGATEKGNYSTTDITVVERTEMTNWITYANGQNAHDVILEPRQTVEVPFTVSVPSSWLASGGQSAAVIISSEDYDPNKTDEGQGLTIETEYVHQVYANVQGSEPLRVDAKFVGLDAPSFVLDASKGLPIELTVKNDGNVWTTAKYNVKVVDKIRYDAVAYESEGDKEVLAESLAPIERAWTETPDIGWFEVQATVVVGGQEFTESKTVIVFPLWLLIIIVAIILLLIVALIIKIRNYRAERQIN
jgi:hypothetical protein